MLQNNWKMAFFPKKDPSEQLTQRNLTSPRPKPADQSELILQLQRQNLYLKNQLFAFVQNSGAYDLYLPCQTQTHCINEKNDCAWTSASWHRQLSPATSRIQPPKLEFSPRRHCLSPRVQSFNYTNQVHQFARSRSPTYEADFGKRLVIETNDLTRRPYRASDRPGMSTVRTSPSRITPKQSLIFSRHPSPQRRQSQFRDLHDHQVQQTVGMMKRNAKSPSFLKNRQACKQNVKESFIINEQTIRQQSQMDRDDGDCTVQSQELSSLQESERPNKFQELKQRDTNQVRRKSKAFTIQYEEGDSCLSIECRLREILYEDHRQK